LEPGETRSGCDFFNETTLGSISGRVVADLRLGGPTLANNETTGLQGTQSCAPAMATDANGNYVLV
jgi:hypothetical protein